MANTGTGSNGKAGEVDSHATFNPFANLKDMLDAMGLPYRMFGHDSSMSGVVNYVKKIDSWMRAGGKSLIANKMGVATRAERA